MTELFKKTEELEDELRNFEMAHTREPVCPHCGHHQCDAWEIDFGGAEGSAEICCGECGKEFFVSRCATFTYSTIAKIRT